jgi:hypothetical protein
VRKCHDLNSIASAFPTTTIKNFTLCNMNFLGIGTIDTLLKYIWTFSFVLLFIRMYSGGHCLLVYVCLLLYDAVWLKKNVVTFETLYVWINSRTVEKNEMYFSDVSVLHTIRKFEWKNVTIQNFACRERDWSELMPTFRILRVRGRAVIN